jgi:hypothetical protein
VRRSTEPLAIAVSSSSISEGVDAGMTALIGPGRRPGPHGLELA